LFHQLKRPSEALNEVKIGLDENKGDLALHALRTEVEQVFRSPESARALNERAEASLDAAEKAELKVAAAARNADTYEREQPYSDALAANPADAAAIAQHVRAIAA